MTVALDLYLSTFFGELGVVLAVAVLVYVCATACEVVQRAVVGWKRARELDALWSETPFTQATPGVASPSKRPFDQAREV